MGPGLALTHDPGDATIATPPDGVVAEPQLRHDTLVRSFGLGRALATGRRPMTRVQTSKSAAPDLHAPRGVWFGQVLTSIVSFGTSEPPCSPQFPYIQRPDQLQLQDSEGHP